MKKLIRYSILTVLSLILFNQAPAQQPAKKATNSQTSNQKTNSMPTAATTAPAKTPDAPIDRMMRANPIMTTAGIVGLGLFQIWMFRAFYRYFLAGIFSRGKGNGMQTVQNGRENEKGSAHFADRKEISNFLRPMNRAQEAGTLLIGKYKETSFFRLKHKFFVLPRTLTTRHTLIAAPSGAGKSRTLFLPNLSITQKVSFIATDPKSELWEYTSGAQLDPIRFAPTDPDRSAAFNWIPLCNDIRTAKRCAEAIMNAQDTGKTDPFWKNGEQNLLTALFIHTAFTQTTTPAHCYEILTSGADNVANALLNSQSEPARRAGKPFSEADDKIKTGLIQGLIGKLQFLDDPNVRRFTSSTLKAFDFAKLRHKPTQIYWCLKQSDVVELQALTALFFNLAILQLIDEEGETPVNFYFDEFANIGKLNNFEKDITLLRGQNIAVIAGLQSKSQLASIYGPENAKTIIENFNNKIILAGLQADTAKDFAELLGKFTYTDIRTSRGKSNNASSWIGGTSSTETYYTSERALLTADELRRLPTDKCILISTNVAPTLLETVFFKGKKNTASLNGCALEIDFPIYNGDAPKRITPKKKKPIPNFEDFE
jgi:type IV secretion system protein VirD4